MATPWHVLRSELLFQDIVVGRMKGRMICGRNLQVLGDFMSSSKYADIKGAVEDQSECQQMNTESNATDLLHTYRLLKSDIDKIFQLQTEFG